MASTHQRYPSVETQPGSRVLKDRDGSSYGAIAVAKGHPGWLAYISEFIEEAKTSGLVQRALERAGQEGQVPPARTETKP